MVLTKSRNFTMSATSLIATILFLIYPIASLPFILYGIYKREKISYVLFCLFMGVFALLFAPSGDLYRYVLMFDRVKQYSFLDIFRYKGLHEVDFLLQIVSWSVNKLGLTSDWVRFIYNTFGYSLICSLHYRLRNSEYYDKSTNTHFLIFLCLIFLVETTSMLYRWGLSTIILIYGIYMLEAEKSKIGWFWLFLSGFNHSTMWFIIVFYIISKIFKFNFNRVTLLIFFILTLVLSTNIVSQILNNFSFFGMSEHFLTYTDGYWANEYLADRSFRANVLAAVNKIKYYLFWIILMLDTRQTKCMKSAVHTLCLLLVITAGYTNLSGRISGIFIYLSFVYYAYNIRLFKKYKEQLKMVTIILFLLFAFNFYKTHRSFEYGKSSMIFTSTLYQIVTSPYEDSWIYRSLDGEGLFIDQ